MSDRNTADNWRLEESSDTTSRWKLEESEQNRISQWELQDEYAEESEWQPVDYAREPRSQGGGWVLPSLVGLALIAVVAYGAWIGLTRLQPEMLGQLLGQNTLLTPVPTVDSAAAALTPDLPVTNEGATDAPTATATPEAAAPPTAAPTIAPAPALVEERFVTISAQYGVNARPNPSTEGEALQVLEQGQEYLVVDETAEWLQVALPTGQLAWISADPQFVTVRAEEMEVTRANQFRAQVNAPLLEGGVATEAPADTETALTTTFPSTATTSIAAPTTEPVVEAPVAPVGAPITGTVNITAGLNARALPETTGELITLLPNDTVLALTGRTADSAWLRSTLSDSITIWVFAEFVNVTGDSGALPVIDDSGASITTAITGTITTAESTPEAPAAAPPGASASATAAVNTILGAAVRAGPSSTEDAIATAVYENVLTVTGRSADNTWLQVDLGEQQGWVLVSAVNLSVDLESLPVVNP